VSSLERDTELRLRVMLATRRTCENLGYTKSETAERIDQVGNALPFGTNIDRLKAVTAQAKRVGLTNADLRRHIGIRQLLGATNDELTGLELFVTNY
jgi:hypothetical protein